MARLREAIQKKISENDDPQKAAIEICKYLDNKMGLHGNGWFDDDEVMLDVLDN
ncbi:hypothetical protein [Methylotenera sp.]|uniref:hypothetical protein n=1 Tax=Methylotenera sp. TaxID=2051956 RepID=UPI0025D52326|nr:hypothetical protein [Methylotenera sp.]